MKKTILLKRLNNIIIEASNNATTKQRISEVRNLNSFYNYIESLELNNLSDNNYEGYNIGHIAIEVLNDIIIKELNSPRSKFLNLINNNSKRAVRLGYKHYKLASIVKSRSDIINALDLDDYQGLLFIVYTATVKGVYTLELNRDLIGKKISAGYVVNNGKKVLDL